MEADGVSGGVWTARPRVAERDFTHGLEWEKEKNIRIRFHDPSAKHRTTRRKCRASTNDSENERTGSSIEP